MQQDRSLTLIQIEKLVQIRTPDEIVAQEVRSRGLQFIPTPKILDELQRHGAGKATLLALRERIPVGTLEIQAPPDSQVALDGADRGTTDSQGLLVLPDLLAGTHRIIVTKSGYRASNLELILAAREYKHFPVQLDWAGGYLTVRLAPPGATTIRIPGLGEYISDVSEMPCPPGNYEIQVTRNGMKPENRTVSIAAGQHAVVEMHLSPDPIHLRKLLEDAQSKLSEGDLSQATQAGTDALALDPGNAAARNLLATVRLRRGDRYLDQRYYPEALAEYKDGISLVPNSTDLLSRKAVAEAGIGDFANAEQDGAMAIAAGNALRIPIAHNHVTGFCRGELILERGKLTYQPQSGNHGFSVTSSSQIDFTESTFTRTNLPEFLVHWRGQDGKDHKYYLVVITYLKETSGVVIPQVFHADGDAVNRTIQLDAMILRMVKLSIP